MFIGGGIVLGFVTTLVGVSAAFRFALSGSGVKALDETRQRVQQATLGHRGRMHDPLYRIRALLRHGIEHLSDRQQAKLQI